MSARPRRVAAFLRKEALQIVRDPSSILLALVMPVALVLLFGYGVSLDVRDVRIAVVLDAPGAAGRELWARLEGSSAFQPVRATSLHEAEELLRDHAVQGWLRVGPDHEGRIATEGAAPVQLVLDGVDANRARLVAGYVEAVVGAWGEARRARGELAAAPRVVVQPRIWFNADSRSTSFLVPGLVALVTTLTGVLLTALVVAREWERGTMEAILATPLSPGELLLAKVVPYYALGMGGMLSCVALGVGLFDVPLRGSLATLCGIGTLFLLASLGLGLAISSAVRVQFVAAQASLIAGFLPAFFLSGLLFDLESTPRAVRWISLIVPARYFVDASHTIFLAGDRWEVLWPDAVALALMAALFLGLARRRTRARLDG